MAPQHCDPVLREIDLYLFQVSCTSRRDYTQAQGQCAAMLLQHESAQGPTCRMVPLPACVPQGLLKPEVKERFAMQHYQWHHKPDEFELAGHFPVQ